MYARFTFICLTAITSLALAASTAGAATTLGSDLTKVPGEYIFCDTTCTSVQSALPGRVVAAPFDGVVVRWRIRTDIAGGPFALRLAAPFTGNQRTSGAVSAQVSPTTGGVTETLTRMPINVGDNIALDYTPANTAAYKSLELSTGAESLYFKPWLAVGAPQDPLIVNNNTELLINADIEADVDRDGYGDETQDTCPTTAGTVSGCAGATPALVLSANKSQRILKLTGYATLDRIGSVDARAVVKYRVGAKQLTVKSKLVKSSLSPGVQSKFSFKFTRSQRASMNARLKLKKKLTAVITYTAKDAAGNKATATSKVRLKR